MRVKFTIIYYITYDITCLENWLKEDCTLTNKELQELLHTHNEIDVSETTISRAVRGLHFTLKRVTERVDAAYTEAAKQARLAYSQISKLDRNSSHSERITHIL